MQFWRGIEIVVGNMGMSELVCSVCVAGSRHKLSAGAYASAAVCRWTLNPVRHVLQLPQERVFRDMYIQPTCVCRCIMPMVFLTVPTTG